MLQLILGHEFTNEIDAGLEANALDLLQGAPDLEVRHAAQTYTFATRGEQRQVGQLLHTLPIVFAEGEELIEHLENDGNVDIRMTLTTPACPVAESLPAEVETRVRAVEGVSAASVELVWDPPWSQDMMSEEAKLELGFL